MERTRSPSAALLLFPWLLLAALAAVATTEDLCKMKDGSVGTCRNISQCEVALTAIKEGEQPVICSFDQITPIVCCTFLTAAAASAKATQMCNEYAEAVFEWKESPSFIVPPQKYKTDTCGMIGVPFVVGGEKTNPNEFPHMALLGYGSRQQPTWLCGGTLISKQYVLTSANCLQSSKGPPTVVRLGELNVKGDNEPNNQHRDYGVLKMIRHPEFSPRTFYNDVGLIKLKQDVKFTKSIRPACLNTLTEIPEQKAIATGWGITDWAETDMSDDLLKVSLPLHPSKVCRNTYSTSNPGLNYSFDGESMICAGDLAGGKDTCQGDSGGPLQTTLAKPYCMYNIIGITSFGKICGMQNSPSVYTRVSFYLPWIASIVW